MKFAPKHPNATFSDKIFFRRMSMDVEICLSKLDVSDKAGWYGGIPQYKSVRSLHLNDLYEIKE
ncbi:hypothetical protein OUZ56_010390 [Daphnia magna]|uniref:Uncharacterized protein n=1 Tax=Daphnia magna TaxID=35525 RepID=A0ABR0AIM1_9CRUS|nr:hypothetical protein OUZ56_010390 [Daphnia magna]